MIKEEKRRLLRQLWSIAGPYQRLFLFAFLLNFLVLFTDLFRPLLQLTAIENIGAGDKGGLYFAAKLLLGVILLDYLARSGYSYIFSNALLGTINRVRIKVFNHVLSMKMAFFDRQPVGSLLTRTINDCEALGETLRAGAATIVMDLTSIIVTFVVLVKINAELSAYLLLAGPPLLFVVRWCGRKLREKFMDVRKHLARSNGFMAEGIVGVEILQLFGQRSSSSEAYVEINRAYRKATIINNYYDALLYALIDGIAALATATILFVAFDLRFGVVDVATAIVFLTQIERIFNPIRQFSSKVAVLQQAMAAIERIFSLLNDNTKIPQGAVQLNSKHLVINFKQVSFKYSQDGPTVLNDICFTVRPGQTLALVGQTGSGKSTIAKLLTRAYDGYQGSIDVDGHELATLNYHSLRGHIAIVHQDVELFPGTLQDNISMFNNDIDQEQIVRAIGLVKATHMVEQLPGGLDFQITEGGGNLSTGQKQLIVFARALAHDAPVVLMDEATSSVDSVTEAWIQEAIAAIMQFKTVIVVAHRLSTIAAADNILVLKNGNIIEQGDHQELLSLEDGYYASLIEASKLQSGEEVTLLR